MRIMIERDCLVRRALSQCDVYYIYFFEIIKTKAKFDTALRMFRLGVVLGSRCSNKLKLI